MEIRIHIGVHRTATTHLQNSLIENKTLIESQRIALPERREAEKALSTGMRLLRGGRDIDKVQSQMLTTLSEGREVDRIIISNEKYAGALSRPFGKELFYPRIGEAMTRFSQLFAGVRFRLYAGIRNPASFIVSCYAESVRTGNRESFEDFIAETNLTGLRWSSMLHRMQTSKGDIPLTVWRYEDYPFIWREVVQNLTGIANREDLVGKTDTINRGLSFHGSTMMRRYLEQYPSAGPDEFANIARVFGERYPSDVHDNLGQSWPEELVEGLTENYDDDWYYIERMDNLETVQLRAQLRV
jgi:hypothetical protein